MRHNQESDMMSKDIIIPPVINPIIRMQLDRMYKHFKKPRHLDIERRCYYCKQWGEVWQMKREYYSGGNRRFIHFSCHFKKIMKKF